MMDDLIDDRLHKRKPDELFTKEQRKDLVLNLTYNCCRYHGFGSASYLTKSIDYFFIKDYLKNN
jgi:hypothetical protein